MHCIPCFAASYTPDTSPFLLLLPLLLWLLLLLAAPAGHASAILVTSDSQAAEVAARQVKNSSWGFVWSQLQELSNFHFER